MNQRREDAKLRFELSQGQARSEAVAAQKLIDDFVATCVERGIAPEPLKARLMTGQVVKTDRKGWYIRANKSLAIGDGGEFYQLTVPGSMLERLRGVNLEPTQPVLVVNRGGRDGDAGDLADFLAWRLAT
ncbi:hypothetical protein [Aestuariimicrobium kwangyangense]|uniref:hypothetical protein n=1 Tax=Aestuariimicrobium kwangyangense TaxID=396389 RepID=UPI0003B3EE79|nr:hypothetical protein [Aestuariimicrobium kwangyangense]